MSVSLTSLFQVREARVPHTFMNVGLFLAYFVWILIVCYYGCMECLIMLVGSGCMADTGENRGEICYSRPSELASPRREWQNLTLVPIRALAQAESFCFERGIVSLRREGLA